MTNNNFCFYLQNRLIQTSPTGGRWYSDTSPFSIPCFGTDQFGGGESVVSNDDGVKFGQAFDGRLEVVEVEKLKGWIEGPVTSWWNVFENKKAFER